MVKKPFSLRSSETRQSFFHWIAHTGGNNGVRCVHATNRCWSTQYPHRNAAHPIPQNARAHTRTHAQSRTSSTTLLPSSGNFCFSLRSRWCTSSTPSRNCWASASGTICFSSTFRVGRLYFSRKWICQGRTVFLAQTAAYTGAHAPIHQHANTIISHRTTPPLRCIECE